MVRIVEHCEAQVLLLETASLWKKMKTELKNISCLKHVIVKESSPLPSDGYALSWKQFGRRGERKGMRAPSINLPFLHFRHSY